MLWFCGHESSLIHVTRCVIPYAIPVASDRWGVPRELFKGRIFWGQFVEYNWEQLALSSITLWSGNDVADGKRRSWRNVALAEEAKKAERASNEARRIPRPPFLIWKACLEPLQVRQKGVCNSADTLEQEVIKLKEQRMSQTRCAAQSIHYFRSAERWPQKNDGVVWWEGLEKTDGDTAVRTT